MWPRAAQYNLAGRKLETDGLIGLLTYEDILHLIFYFEIH
jgi:hypothetical protein